MLSHKRQILFDSRADSIVWMREIVKKIFKIVKVCFDITNDFMAPCVIWGVIIIMDNALVFLVMNRLKYADE